ncbi:DUF3108 domain-containing protein [Cochleicola gelatinilyticus]|uniref:ATP-dependent exonuclease n=1 Tax=Cochleicola gelatinilyticus TaxID=1763537 RepID=A0A167IX21_9FLAO|nr:DUF3108 domain-containing protein [Cochleicola gelatinilyticus]OAB80098.1 ATP-dependent exonuclease [Cochleicola gelatinilyticus]
MKKVLTLLLIFNITLVMAQDRAFGDGEYLKFRVHYGLVTAGYATLEVDEVRLNGKEVFHIQGFGATTGLSKFFFKVEDKYQSYVDKEKDIPYRFIRKIDEGGYTKDIQIDFNHASGMARVNDKKHNKIEEVPLPPSPQDMVSAFYYLRNHVDIATVKEGDVVDMNMFFDRGNHKFRLKFLGRETLKTNFGKVPCLKFRPYVEAGRVFKEEESLTVWVTDDENKMPVLIKAELAVGSLKASLTEYKGLKHQFRIIPD